MAAQTAVTAQTATLSGTTADSIAFSGDGFSVAVTNHDAADLLYFNVNSSTVPVADADDLFVVLPGTTVSLVPGGLVKTVRVVGDGGKYTVAIV